VGNATGVGSGWTRGGQGTLCSRGNLLALNRLGRVNTTVPLLLDTGAGTQDNRKKQEHVSIIMYDPPRFLVIPIKDTFFD